MDRKEYFWASYRCKIKKHRASPTNGSSSEKGDPVVKKYNTLQTQSTNQSLPLIVNFQAPKFGRSREDPSSDLLAVGRLAQVDVARSIRLHKSLRHTSPPATT